jgi:NitT/TauT family transport system substrate-binding protein
MAERGIAGYTVESRRDSVMRSITRRSVIAGAVTLPFVARRSRAAPLTNVRFTLDWKYQGVHAWFYVARDKGYFDEEGLEVEIDQGEGSAATIARIVAGNYEAGFGDINALIAVAAQKPEQAPRMIYEMYNRGPSVLVTRADGPIRSLKDLEGRTVGAPAGSASARLLPLLARINRVDYSKINSQNIAANLQEQMLISSKLDGILGFNYSIYINLAQAKIDPERDVRWFSYSDYGLDLYSNGVMASQSFLKEKPKAARGLVRAIHRGFKATIGDVDGAIKAMMTVEPLLNADVEKRRLEYTLRNVMGTPWTKANGFGGVDTAKLETSIKAVVEGYDLPRTPRHSEVFDPTFLPLPGERSLSLPG